MAVTAFSPVPEKCIKDVFADGLVIPEKCIKDVFGDGVLIGQYTVQCDENVNNTCSGFLAASASAKAIIMSFRGTHGHGELGQEFIDTLTQAPIDFIAGGKVNPFFSNAFNKLWNTGMKDAFLSYKNRHIDYSLWITGHSLGAAMAAIAGGTIIKLGYFAPEKTSLYTFGEPRVGNKDYAAAMDSLLPIVYRVIHHHDMVPHLPLKGMLGYFHHKSEVWYNNDMKRGDPYIICEEDEGAKCSDSEAELIWSDHDIYFGASIHFALNGCKKL
uniref:Fungal lipase-like domain-containing protein n=1 Tax=Panagrolaimus sp. PS1159 TaxID=55785 RepID=A0AC35FN65_9BILA